MCIYVNDSSHISYDGRVTYALKTQKDVSHQLKVLEKANSRNESELLQSRR